MTSEQFKAECEKRGFLASRSTTFANNQWAAAACRVNSIGDNDKPFISIFDTSLANARSSVIARIDEYLELTPEARPEST